MQTLGIIGGLGPQTTANLYMRVQELVDPELMDGRAPVIINSIPIPPHLERENIIHERNFESVLPYLVEAGQSLEKAGADFLVLACNSLHVFEGEIAESTNIPFVSMVDATVDFIATEGVEKVGLLGTYKTNSSGLYTEALQSQGIEVAKLGDSDQRELGETIIRLIDNSYGSQDKALLKHLIKGMSEEGSKKIILACTDLQLILDPGDPDIEGTIVDSMEILARCSAEMIQS